MIRPTRGPPWALAPPRRNIPDSGFGPIKILVLVAKMPCLEGAECSAALSFARNHRRGNGMAKNPRNGCIAKLLALMVAGIVGLASTGMPTAQAQQAQGVPP